LRPYPQTHVLNGQVSGVLVLVGLALLGTASSLRVIRREV
jgi:hypothetical protein